MNGVLGIARVGRHAGAVAVTVALAAVVGPACAEEADPPDTASLAVDALEGWEAQDTYEHTGSGPYDQVAVAPAGDGAVWFTRSGGNGDGLAVATMSGGQVTGEDEVTAPDGIAIPVGVAADDAGWTAVAVTRDRPDGTNTGVVVWRLPGVASQAARPESLDVSGVVPGAITVGRADGVSVVAGMVGGTVATWVSDGGRWAMGTPDLGVGPVASARVTGAGDGFVLAVVARDGSPSVWASPDGLAWSQLDVPDPGTGLAAVGMLAPVDGGEAVAVGWLAGDVADEAPLDAADVVVHLVEGTAVTPFGTISAEPGDGVERIDVNAAARRDDWLLVAGATVAGDGSVRPGLWAGSGEEWARSSQEELVRQPDVEFRTLGPSGDDALYGLLTERGGLDVHLWHTVAP
jgi:hypothetical protein